MAGSISGRRTKVPGWHRSRSTPLAGDGPTVGFGTGQMEASAWRPTLPAMGTSCLSRKATTGAHTRSRDEAKRRRKRQDVGGASRPHDVVDVPFVDGRSDAGGRRWLGGDAAHGCAAAQE